MTQDEWTSELQKYNTVVRISADFLHIPGFIARPFGHYVKPVFLWIYRHTFAYIPRETGNYLRALCGDVSILLILFQLLIKIRDDIEFYRINPFVSTSGLIILGDQRYYIPRKKITIYLDTVLRLPLILVYEITDPFMTWAVWDHVFRSGHDVKKIKLINAVLTWLRGENGFEDLVSCQFKPSTQPALLGMAAYQQR